MYNGLAGGIGQGLQSFVQAYQQALNYQLEKSKAASMTDYQQKMAHAADLNSKAGLLTAWGPEAVEKYDPDPTTQDQSSGPPAPVVKPPVVHPGLVSPPVTPDPESQPGFIGPPKPPGLIPPPAPQSASAAPATPPGGLAGSPMWMRRAQFEQGLASDKELNDLTLKAKESGSNFQYAKNPQTGRPMVTGQGPLTGNAALERQQKEAQISGEISGSRSPNATIAGQYDDRPAVKSARGSQVAMNQMIDNYRHPSPYGDASLVLNAFQIKFPGKSQDVNSIDEFEHSQAVPDQWKQKLSQAQAGTMDQGTRDNLLRDGISTFRANVDSLRGEQDKFSKRADSNGVKDKSFLEEHSIDKTYADAIELQKQMGPYVPPAQRQNPGFMTRALGLVGGGTPQALSAPKGPPPGLNFEQFKAWKKSNAQ